MSILDDLAALPDDSAPAEGFSFKSLLSEAMAHKADGDKLKETRKALKSGVVLNAEEAAELRRMEAAREWLPKASVAMFQVQHCTCCEAYTPSLTGIFQRQASRHNRATERWVVASEGENYGLPKEVKTNEVDVPFCAMCLDQWGFPGDQLGITFDEPEVETDEEEESLEDLFEAEFAAMQLPLPLEDTTALAPKVEPMGFVMAEGIAPDWDTRADDFSSREQTRQQHVHGIAYPEEVTE